MGQIFLYVEKFQKNQCITGSFRMELQEIDGEIGK